MEVTREIMSIEKSIKSAFVMMILIISIATCNSTPTPSANTQVVNIIESELVTGQITQTKIFTMRFFELYQDRGSI